MENTRSPKHSEVVSSSALALDIPSEPALSKSKGGALAFFNTFGTEYPR
jgi:hypothetical protein